MREEWFAPDALGIVREHRCPTPNYGHEVENPRSIDYRGALTFPLLVALTGEAARGGEEGSQKGEDDSQVDFS
jgi:hypothetical protein